MKTMISSFALAVAGLVGVQAANAGGYSPLVAEPPVVVAPVVETQAGNWQGGYGGVTLGYAFNGDDRFGVTGPETGGKEMKLGNLKLSGVNGGIRAGYRWQRDRFVFGPEVSFEDGSVKDDFNYVDYIVDDGEKTNLESKLKNRTALVMKAGYEVQPDTLVYGIAGVSRAKFEYSVSGISGRGSVDYNTRGGVLGVGVERKVNDRMSVTGELEHNFYRKKNLTIDDLTTAATPKFTNVKVGLNFKF